MGCPDKKFREFFDFVSKTWADPSLVHRHNTKMGLALTG